MDEGKTNADIRLEPEVANVHKRWTWVGGAAGAALGYIVANIPGAVAGGESERPHRCLDGVDGVGRNHQLYSGDELTTGFAGNRLGAIRDAKGKPVAQVFATLPGTQKAQVRISFTFAGLPS